MLVDETIFSLGFMIAYLKLLAVKLLLRFVPGAIKILEWILRLGTNTNTNNIINTAAPLSSASSNGSTLRERKLSRQTLLNSGNPSQLNRKYSAASTASFRRNSRSSSVSSGPFLDKFKPSTIITDLSEPFENLFTVPSDLFSFTNLFRNLLLEINLLARLYRFWLLMRERLRTMFRWRPTSPEDLDQAESRIFSFLKCKFKSYYVDIGKAWDLEHVRIWTVEIPRVDRDQKTATATATVPVQSPKQNQQTFASQQKKNNQKSANAPAVLDENKNEGLPLVMIHGFAAGVGFWALNFDELSNYGNRTIYAFDMLGFAKSSRPRFSFPKFTRMTPLQRSKAEAEKMEDYMVESIEKWRRAIGGPLDQKFILLGHSFGAYLSLAYSLKYPNNVAHLILADPWGLPPENHSRHLSSTHYTSSRQLPFWFKTVAKLLFSAFSPLTPLRALGPWGPGLIKRMRPDIKRKFQRLTNDARDAENQGSEGGDADISSNLESDEEIKEKMNNGKNEKEIEADANGDLITDYIYHANAQSPPSGEIAFQKLCTSTAWARLPMLERIIELDSNLSLTFIYGSRSWVDPQSGFQAKYILATSSTAPAAENSSDERETADEESERVRVLMLQGAGHHVYADMPEEFNQMVLKVCTEVDTTFQAGATDESTADEIEEYDSFMEQQLAHQSATSGGGNRIKPFNMAGSSNNNTNGTNSTSTHLNGYNSKFSGTSLPKQIIPEEENY